VPQDSTPKRFSELPEYTQEFFASLREEDIQALEEGIRLARAAKTVGKFWKWTALTIVAMFAGMATLGQSVDWLWHRIFR
jgi:hypothetical protein